MTQVPYPGADDYSGWLKPSRWATVTNLPDGRWLAVWEFEMESFDATRLEEVETAAADAERGFTPHITARGESGLVASIETPRSAIDDDYVGLTLRLFRLIDDRLGRIRTIQGSPRNWHSPFRFE